VFLSGSAHATLPDSDGDGDVDLRDLAGFQDCLGQLSGGPSCAALDSNGDSIVGLADWPNVIVNFYGPFSPCPADIVQSPMPDHRIPAVHVTVHGRLPAGSVGVEINGTSTIIQSDGSYFTPVVGLAHGDNTLRVDALAASGAITCSRLVTVERVANIVPLTLRLSPGSGPPGTKVIARVDTPLAIEGLYVDFNGDGNFDSYSTTHKATYVYDQIGRFAVFAVARTLDGLCFSNLLPMHGVDSGIVVIGAESQTLASANVAQPIDIWVDEKGQITVLGADSRLTTMDGSLRVLHTLTLSGLTTPSAFAFTPQRDVLVADAGSHRVFKFRADGVLDEGFGDEGIIGGEGSEVGDMRSPTDVAVADDGSIYVADAGNVRLVKLDRRGGWLKHVVLTEFPRGLGMSNGGLYIVDGSERISIYNKSLERTETLVLSAANLTSIFVGAELVAVSDDRVLVRTLRGGFLADFLKDDGLTARIAVGGLDHQGAVMVVGDTLTGRILRLVVPLDPPGASPLDTWYHFIALLEAGRVSEAALLLGGEIQQAFFGANVLDVGALLDWLHRYEAFTLVGQSNNRADYEVTVTGLVNKPYVTFERLGPESGWRISAF
jgi:hypothetical protein